MVAWATVALGGQGACPPAFFFAGGRHGDGLLTGTATGQTDAPDPGRERRRRIVIQTTMIKKMPTARSIFLIMVVYRESLKKIMREAHEV